MGNMYYVEACERCAWHIQTWRKDGDGEISYIPYKCRSWRHEGECRLWKGAQDFVRISEGMNKRDEWSHLTLTFRQRGERLSVKTFKRGLACWSKLRKRIIRAYGDMKYIQTWEVHRSGWPHVHIAISNHTLYDLPKQHPKALFNIMLGSAAQACGFGRIGELSPLRDEKAFAGYLCKLARELTGAGKEYQVPVKAPRHFRRIRASVRLLPPPHKNPDITGMLVFSEMPDEC